MPSEMPFPADYLKIASTIRAKTTQGGMSGDDMAFVCADLLAAVVDGVTGTSFAGGANGSLQTLVALAKGDGSSRAISIIPNPWFVNNELHEAPSRFTQKYIKSRGLKGAGGTALSLAGTAASGSTLGINFADVAIHGNATGSTLAHLVKLRAIAGDKKYAQSVTIGAWCSLLIKMKATKTVIRGGQTAAACIPAASLPAAIASSVAKTGVKLTMTNACYAAAAGIHWRAYQEQAISGGLGLGTGRKVGPASRMFYELFTRRGATALFGKYDIDNLVKEPGGWMALGDKIVLM